MTDFNWRRRDRGQRDSMCRLCRAAYRKGYYAANKQKYIDRAAVRSRALYLERTKWLIDYFKTHPCLDCGESDPVVLEFGHLRDKEFDIAQSLHYRSWQKILDEIAKCEVVCRNCHRRRESTRSGSLRMRLTQSQRRLDF